MKTWTCIARCSTCKKVLNTAKGVPEDKKGQVEMSAPLAARGCKEHDTLSDLNYHFDLEWIEEVAA